MPSRQCDHQYATHSLQTTPLARDYVILLIMAPASQFRNGNQLIRQTHIYIHIYVYIDMYICTYINLMVLSQTRQPSESGCPVKNNQCMTRKTRVKISRKTIQNQRNICISLSLSGAARLRLYLRLVFGTQSLTRRILNYVCSEAKDTRLNYTRAEIDTLH